jgi:transposase-like protein
MAGASAGLAAPTLAGPLHRSTQQVRARRRTLVASRPAARPYGAHEDEAIRACLTNGGDLVGLARRLGRTPDAVRLHAQQLGIYRPRPRRRWADWEDALIRDGYTSALSCARIASQLPHRSAGSVAARARKLGLATYARRWSRNDELRLADLTARGVTLEDTAQRLGRTPEAIRRRAARLGVAPPPPAPPPRGSRRWTGEEDHLLALHHALNPATLAQLLGRTDAAVCRRLCALNLRADAQRSPHHPVRRHEGLPTPGELAVIERELVRATPRRRWVLLRWFETAARGPHPRRNIGNHATT